MYPWNFNYCDTRVFGCVTVIKPDTSFEATLLILYFVDPPKHVTYSYAVSKRKTIGGKMRDLYRLIKLVWHGGLSAFL